MSNIEVTIEGLEAILKQFDALSDAARQEAVRKSLLRGGHMLEGWLKAALSHAGHGRVYKHGNVEHRASAPGEYPAPDTQALSGSIKTEAEGDIVAVGTSVEYAQPLEYKPPGAGGRPFMRRILDEKGEELGQLIVEDIRQQLEGSK